MRLLLEARLPASALTLTLTPAPTSEPNQACPEAARIAEGRDGSLPLQLALQYQADLTPNANPYP